MVARGSQLQSRTNAPLTVPPMCPLHTPYMPPMCPLHAPYAPLCTPYMPPMCPLCAPYVPSMHPLCAPTCLLCAPTHPLCTPMHPLHAPYIPLFAPYVPPICPLHAPKHPLHAPYTPPTCPLSVKRVLLGPAQWRKASKFYKNNLLDSFGEATKWQTSKYFGNCILWIPQQESWNSCNKIPF